MTVRNDTLWTIDQLGSQVALALSDNYDGQANGRIRDVPDRRTIRYYTTLGLIDRAAEMRGRTALYGRRHLLQIVAIKRLQSRGLTLQEVQSRLVGLPNSELERIAQLPEEMPSEPNVPAGSHEPQQESRSERFWSQPPAEVETTEEEQIKSPPLMQGVKLEEAVTLLLETHRPLEHDDIEAIEAAAAPLVKLLRKRRLI